MIKNLKRMVLGIAIISLISYSHAAIPKNEEGALVTSLAPLVKTVAPAVVNIRVSQTVKSRSPYDDEMFRRFLAHQIPLITPEKSKVLVQESS